MQHPRKEGSVDTVRIMIVDDHPLLRDGIRRMLEGEPDFRIAGEASDGQQALDLALELLPQCVLMDVNLPLVNGLQATRRLKAAHPEIAVIVLTAYHDDMQVLHAIQAGASAYFPKDVTSTTLVEAIRQVTQGKYVIDDHVLERPEVAKWLLKQFQDASPQNAEMVADDMLLPLSAREMQILELITRGFANKEIARELRISRQTVKNHMTNILHKLAVNDRTQAAVYALRRGWIRLEDTKS
jgi:DNA-binding NarL/FixJ family response regulator